MLLRRFLCVTLHVISPHKKKVCSKIERNRTGSINIDRYLVENTKISTFHWFLHAETGDYTWRFFPFLRLTLPHTHALFLEIFEIQLNFAIIVHSNWLSTLLLQCLCRYMLQRECDRRFLLLLLLCVFAPLTLYSIIKTSICIVSSTSTCIGITFLHTLFLYFACKIVKRKKKS